ncbi:Ran guanine nucleotide release factor [Merluccius polli]|uniref:Ran guanine nucleotide release factor n=1 Tax=Merluccius polli TaxID=89951 RepID=A0AA47N217_MERPO|nr:Ran guanine nucleotide release factor [Merluccius polli]
MLSPGGGRPLFGGAMSARVPPGARDVSDLREVPDHQEAFAHGHTDQSLVVELLELQAHVADRDAARYHFEDLAGSNEARGGGPGTPAAAAALLPRSELALVQCSSAWVLSGAQCVSKFNEEARNEVAVHLGLFRLPQFSTDVLVTFNDPVRISPASSSASGPSGPSGPQSAEPWTVHDFHRLLHSLTLHDPGLFG